MYKLSIWPPKSPFAACSKRRVMQWAHQKQQLNLVHSNLHRTCNASSNGFPLSASSIACKRRRILPFQVQVVRQGNKLFPWTLTLAITFTWTIKHHDHQQKCTLKRASFILVSLGKQKPVHSNKSTDGVESKSLGAVGRNAPAHTYIRARTFTHKNMKLNTSERTQLQ